MLAAGGRQREKGGIRKAVRGHSNLAKILARYRRVLVYPTVCCQPLAACYSSTMHPRQWIAGGDDFSFLLR